MATWLRIVLWTVLLSSAVDARADEPAEPAELPPVVVPLPPDAPAPESAPRRDPTGAVTSVDVAERRDEAHVASELISSAPGVLLQDRGGLLQSRTLTLRGASSNGVLVLLDGVPLNGAGGAVDLGRIPLAIVDRFEVLRGGAGARYGSGALGGVVNVVTRRPGSGGIVSGGLTYGSFGTGLAHLAGTGALLGGHGLVVLHGARSEGDFGYLFDDRPALEGNPLERRIRANNDVLTGGGMVRFRRDLGADTVLDATAELSLDDRGLAGTALNPTPGAWSETQRYMASARVLRQIELGELSARAWARRDASHFQGGSFGEGLPQTELSAGAEAHGARLFGIHGVSGSLSVGYDGLESTAPQLPSADPRWFKASAMAADEILLADGVVTLMPSMRVDFAGPFTTFSPKLGAAVALPAGFQLRANAGQAHRAPSFLELYVMQGNLLPNPDLRPERALYADLTVAREGEWSSFAVTGFHSLYEDLIAYELYPPLLARPFNFNTALVQGVELEARARYEEHLSAELAYTLTFSSNLRDDPRFYLKELPYRPRHRVVGRVSGGVRRARARAEIDLQSEQSVNRTGTVTLPARAFLNLGVTANVWDAPRVSLALDVKNVLDAQSADFDGYPLPGRAAYLTLSFALEESKP